MLPAQSNRPPRPLGRRQLGRLGEIWVAGCLEDRGYRILGRNVRLGPDEIDIVARRAMELLFVEVKTRRSDAIAPPEASIDRRKRRAMERAGRRFVARFPGLAWGEEGVSPRPMPTGGRACRRPQALLVVASVMLESARALPRIRYLRAWPPLGGGETTLS